MRGRTFSARRPIFAAIITAALFNGSALAQTASPATPAGAPAGSPAEMALDPNVVQAGCASCGGGAYGSTGGLPGCNSCMGAGCDGPRCVPGRMECCEPCEACSM